MVVVAIFLFGPGANEEVKLAKIRTDLVPFLSVKG